MNLSSAKKSMAGRICLVTGANAGIGKATAFGLANIGATVVMVCRSRDRGEVALAEIKQKSSNDSISLLVADLASQASIRKLAEDFRGQHPALHVLINNAGIIPRKRLVTEDGFETQFAVNHIAPFLLTNLLLDVLKSSAPARIVTVASDMHRGATIDFDDIQSERSYSPTQVYARTKLANVLFTCELAKRLQGTKVTANCLHPGVVATNLLADGMGIPRPLKSTTRLMGTSPEKGAKTSIYLAVSPAVEGVSGRYFVRQKAVESSKTSYDENLASRLWRVSAELTGLSDPIRV
jgi:NAD(P)-dependent dehydrogenase (short-subunit alcohol dehydrogenase family)